MVLVDFETAVRCKDETELLKETEALLGELEATHGRGGQVVVAQRKHVVR